jgi:hypothetical protein
MVLYMHPFYATETPFLPCGDRYSEEGKVPYDICLSRTEEYTLSRKQKDILTCFINAEVSPYLRSP